MWESWQEAAKTKPKEGSVKVAKSLTIIPLLTKVASRSTYTVLAVSVDAVS